MTVVSESIKITMVDRTGVDDLLPLLKRVHPGILWSKELLQWQYFSSPCGDSKVHTIQIDGLVVALYVITPVKFSIGGNIFDACMLQDAMTHPDYRGRGYYSHMVNMALNYLRDNQCITYALPNKTVEYTYRRANWFELMKVPHRTLSLFAASPSKPCQLAIEEIDGDFTEVVTDIWVDSKLNVGVHRDQAFLNWRYSKPNACYRKFMIESDHGYFVLKHYKDESGELKVHLCDLVLRYGSRELLPQVLDYIYQHCMNSKCILLTAWLPAEHPYANAFDKLDLKLVESHDRYFFVNPIDNNPKIEGLFDPSQWHLTHADSDVY